MSIVALVSEKYGLVGNSVASIEKLMSKNLFRKLQAETEGVFSTLSFEVYSLDELLDRVKNMKIPIIIKPSESSGSRGTTRIDKLEEALIVEAYKTCTDFSRSDNVTYDRNFAYEIGRASDKSNKRRCIKIGQSFGN